MRPPRQPAGLSLWHKRPAPTTDDAQGRRAALAKVFMLTRNMDWKTFASVISRNVMYREA